MHTILGAGGAIANELAKVLIANNQMPRLVSRNPKPMPGADTMVADFNNSAHKSMEKDVACHYAKYH